MTATKKVAWNETMTRKSRISARSKRKNRATTLRPHDPRAQRESSLRAGMERNTIPHIAASPLAEPPAEPTLAELALSVDALPAEAYDDTPHDGMIAEATLSEAEPHQTDRSIRTAPLAVVAPLEDDAVDEHPSQPSQSTTKLPTLAIMAAVHQQRLSQGNPNTSSSANRSGVLPMRETEAKPDAKAEATNAPGETRSGYSERPSSISSTLPALPRLPQALKDQLREQAPDPFEDESNTVLALPESVTGVRGTSGKRGVRSQRADALEHDEAEHDPRGDTLSHLAARADIARSALHETLRRHHVAAGADPSARRNAGARAGTNGDTDGNDSASRGSLWGSQERASADASASHSGSGHRPLPPVDPIPGLMVLHAGIGAVAALLAAGALVIGSPLVGLFLALVGIAGGTSMVASLLGRAPARRRAVGTILLVGQFAMMGWAFLLVGPRAALLFFIPGMAFWAMRALGRNVFPGVLVGALLLYGAAAVTLVAGPLAPVLTLAPQAGVALDGALAAIGLLLALIGIEGLLGESGRAVTRARAREAEATYLRARLRTLEREIDEESEAVQSALRRALRQHRVRALTGEGPLADLYPAVNAIAERVLALSQDHDERLRLEGALRRLAQALERSWLGLPWSWPEATDTPVDEVVALLRSGGLRADSAALGDTPSPLVPIPSLEVARERLRREAERVPERSRATTPTRLRSLPRGMLPELDPPTSGASSPHWSRWD